MATTSAARKKKAQTAGTDNPDLSMAFIEDVLIAQAESKAGMGEPYEWGVAKG